MAFTRWSDDERCAFGKCVHEERTIKDATRRFYNENPAASQYKDGTFYRKRAKEGVRECLDLYLEGVRENPGTTSYAQRPERIATLVGLLKTALLQLEECEASENGLTVSAFIKLSGESRSLIKEIREEAEPFDSELKSKASPFEEYLETAKKQASKKVAEEVFAAAEDEMDGTTN